jgi:hypothetical protein
VGDIINEIQTEIYDALAHIENGTAVTQNGVVPRLSDIELFKSTALAATVSLTLDVTTNDGLNPSLSYIDPLHPRAPAGTSGSPAEQQKFTGTASGQFSQTAHRNITFTFDLIFDPTHIPPQPYPSKQNGIFGSGLDLGQVVSTGLLFCPTQTKDWPLPRKGISTPDLTPLNNPNVSANVRPTFSAEEDFTVVLAGGVTPTWSLVHFSGLGSSSGGGSGSGGSGGGSGGGGGASSAGGGGNPGSGFLSYGHTVKDTILIAFARCKRPQTDEEIASVISERMRGAGKSLYEINELSASERTKNENELKQPVQQDIQAALQQTHQALTEMRLQQLLP